MITAELHIVVLAANAAAGAAPAQESAAATAGSALQQILSRATAVAGHAVTAVLGSKAAEVAPALGRLPVSLIVNRDWEEGIAASIRAALLSLPGSCSAVLLLHSDQVAVSSADLQRLGDTWRRSPRAIVAAQYGGGYGVPAIFPRTEFPSLLRLRGGQSAADLLRNPAAEVIGVPMPGAATDLARPTGNAAPSD